MIGRISLALLCLVAAAAVHAEPYFAVRQGLKCSGCHVNPTGGGLRNAFGDTWAQTIMAEQFIDTGVPERWTGNVSRYLALGANLRANGTYVDTPDTNSQSEFDLEEARVYLDLAAIPDRLSIYIDQRLAPGGSGNLEAYARYWTKDHKWYVKAGQMYLPYGFRFEDDSAFVRQATAIGMTTPDRGVEVGLETTNWNAQFAVTNGTAASSEVDQGKQFSARGEYVQSIWRFGASLNFNNADSGERKMGGLFAGVLTGPIAWLAEADYVKDEAASGERKQIVGLLEANWLIKQGHNLKITAEHLDPDDDIDEDERARYSAVWEYTPMQFLQLRLGVRVYDGIPQSDVDNRKLAFAQVHAFF
jgi:hypothetical protein